MCGVMQGRGTTVEGRAPRNTRVYFNFYFKYPTNYLGNRFPESENEFAVALREEIGNTSPLKTGSVGMYSLVLP